VQGLPDGVMAPRPAGFGLHGPQQPVRAHAACPDPVHNPGFQAGELLPGRRHAGPKVLFPSSGSLWQYMLHAADSIHVRVHGVQILPDPGVACAGEQAAT
jgi:hypothetical protein